MTTDRSDREEILNIVEEAYSNLDDVEPMPFNILVAPSLFFYHLFVLV